VSETWARSTARGALHNARVLLVDDDAGDQYLVRRALASHEHTPELVVIDDGDSALDYLLPSSDREPQQARPDLVLLDLNLPGCDGFSILSAVRGEERLASMPVIVISTSSREEDIAHSYRLGCNAYVVKPESASTFIEVIHSVSNYWLGVDPRSSA
jgi:two-component system response regulator